MLMTVSYGAGIRNSSNSIGAFVTIQINNQHFYVAKVEGHLPPIDVIDHAAVIVCNQETAFETEDVCGAAVYLDR